MIRYLAIRNLAVIESAAIELTPGFNVLTGETGAGKSILVEAVGLLLGGRASADLVRTGEEAATVEAVLEAPGGRETVVRREVTSLGRSRAFVDDTLVTAASLRDLTSGLVELHGQHDHQRLLDSTEHLGLLDTWARLQPQRRAVAAAFGVYQQAQQELERERALAAGRASRQELVQSRLTELDLVAPQAHEDEDLAERRLRLRNADRIERLGQALYAELYEAEGSLLAALSRMWKKVEELAQLDSRFTPHLLARDSVKAHLEDLAMTARGIATEIESPGELAEAEERLATLERLKRAYGPALDDVRRTWEALRMEHRQAEEGEGHLDVLTRQLAAASSTYLEGAQALSTLRRRAAPEFSHALEAELTTLAMPDTRIGVRLSHGSTAAEWRSDGLDSAELFLSANVGEDTRPLTRVASGGELSRLMLAIRTLTARDEDGRTLIFDEVDAGVGGGTGSALGRKLAHLGSRFQVVCITHLPQIAAAASTHFLIEKTQRNARTHTLVTALRDDARLAEIARMLTGSAASQGSRASARELLAAGAKGEAMPKAKGESHGKRQ